MNRFYWRSESTFAQGAEGALRALCELRAGRVTLSMEEPQLQLVSRDRQKPVPFCQLMSYDYSSLEPAEAIAAFATIGLDCSDMNQDCKHQCSQ